MDVGAYWTPIFGNARPVWIEIGSGRGEFLAAIASLHPERNFLGIERSARRVRNSEALLARRGLVNTRILAADAACAVTMLPPACVAGCFVLYPDPWWKRRHRRRRLLTPAFIEVMARTVIPGGTIHLVTDVAEYFALAQRWLDAEPTLERTSGGEALAVSTAFARKAQARGGRAYSSVHRRR